MAKLSATFFSSVSSHQQLRLAVEQVYTWTGKAEACIHTFTSCELSPHNLKAAVISQNAVQLAPLTLQGTKAVDRARQYLSQQSFVCWGFFAVELV